MVICRGVETITANDKGAQPCVVRVQVGQFVEVVTLQPRKIAKQGTHVDYSRFSHHFVLYISTSGAELVETGNPGSSSSLAVFSGTAALQRTDNNYFYDLRCFFMVTVQRTSGA